MQSINTKLQLNVPIKQHGTAVPNKYLTNVLFRLTTNFSGSELDHYRCEHFGWFIIRFGNMSLAALKIV